MDEWKATAAVPLLVKKSDCRMNAGLSRVDKATGMLCSRTEGFMEHLLVWPQQLQVKPHKAEVCSATLYCMLMRQV